MKIAILKLTCFLESFSAARIKNKRIIDAQSLETRNFANFEFSNITPSASIGLRRTRSGRFVIRESTSKQKTRFWRFENFEQQEKF